MESLIFICLFIGFFLSIELIQVLFSYQFKKCEDCGVKKNLIISRYTISLFLKRIVPSEWRCNYHYRKYHGVKQDDFTTELDDKEFVSLVRMTSGLL